MHNECSTACAFTVRLAQFLCQPNLHQGLVRDIPAATTFVVLAILLFIMLSNFSQSDKCLDSGGRWNNATKSCEK
ncbi:MAG: hypothetical protein FGM20_05685 [Burkholderiaceae bacterium]|nr:hypothetical protein [Burkholderiaceae bacterium]